MKTEATIFVFLVIAFTCLSCKKDNPLKDPYTPFGCVNCPFVINYDQEDVNFKGISGKHIITYYWAPPASDSLDLDGDGIFDLEFSVLDHSSSWQGDHSHTGEAKIKCLHEGMKIMVSKEQIVYQQHLFPYDTSTRVIDFYSPVVYHEGDTINPATLMVSDSIYFSRSASRIHDGGPGLDYSYSGGSWLAGGIGYVGISFRNGGYTMLGWVKVKLVGNGEIDLDKYALKSFP